MELTLTHARDALRRTPVALEGLLRGLPEPWARVTDGEDAWSPHDVVVHLIHADDVNWIPRARVVLERGEAQAFASFDRTGLFDEARAKPLDELLDAFTDRRNRSLHALDALGLGPADLTRRGRHPELGEVTLGQLLAAWVVHDQNHVAQVVATLARQYRAAVGPWRAYLGILG